MASSGSILRRASELVFTYLRGVPYYVDVCSKPLDPERWFIDQESALKIESDVAMKLLTKARSNQESARSLMVEIEAALNGFFVRNIYHSRNWSHAYTLLNEFSINIISPHAALAQQHLDRIERFVLLPEKQRELPIHPTPGDYHEDIKAALSRLLRELTFVATDDKRNHNHLLLLIVYASCYATKKQHRVELHSSAWNSFKRSLEGYFIELTSMPPASSESKKLPDGSFLLSHSVPSCWEDMNEIENTVDKWEGHMSSSELGIQFANTQKLSNALSSEDMHRLNDTFSWMLELSKTSIVPKVIYAFSA